jgi:phage terminase large subunit-like protein
MSGMSPDGSILYLGNYITEHGNVQHLLNRAKNDHRLRIRNIPVMADGHPLWASKYALTDEEAQKTGKVSIEDKQRQLGHLVFSYEMMNQPIDETLAEFKKEWFQYATEGDIQNLSLNTFVAIDTAVSQKESADFTGVTITRISTENKRYITAYKLKVNPTELINHIFYLHEKYRPVTVGIEETVFLLAIKPFLEEEMRKRNTFIVITPLKHGGVKKETRIRGLIPLFQSKSVFFVGDCKDLEDEMRSFPRGLHDDVLDSVAYSEQIAYKPTDMSDFDAILNQDTPIYPDIGL